MNRREALKALTGLPALQSLAVANIAPTDVIVAECSGQVSQREAENIKTALERIWPGQKIVICDEAMKLKVLRSAPTPAHKTEAGRSALRLLGDIW